MDVQNRRVERERFPLALFGGVVLGRPLFNRGGAILVVHLSMDVSSPLKSSAKKGNLYLASQLKRSENWEPPESEFVWANPTKRPMAVNS